MKTTFLLNIILTVTVIVITNTILSAQNVGIGTTTPTNTLEIKSALPNTSGLRFTNLTLASPQVLSNGKSLSVDANGDVILVPSSGDAWLLVGNSNATSASFLGTTNAFDVVFKAANTEAMRILNTNGNVGIGTATPTEKLDVVGNLKFSGALLPNGIAGTVGQVLTSAGVGVAPTWQANNSWLIMGNAGTTPATNFLGTTDAQSLVFKTNNTEAMRVLTNGNVGIGTTSPLALLDVQLTANTKTALNASKNFGGLMNTDAAFIGGTDVGYTNTGIYVLQKDNVSFASPNTNIFNTVLNSNSLLIVKGDGNVGINNATPAYKLQVKGDIVAEDGVHARSLFNVGYSSSAVITDIIEPWTDNGIKIYDGNSNSHLHIEPIGLTTIQSYSTGGVAKGLLENNSYSDLALQDKGANVGIGTISPVGKLHVVDNSAATFSIITRLERIGATGFFDFHSGATIADWNGLVLANDKSLIFSNDNDPDLDANSGLVIAPWVAGTNPTGGFKGIKIMENGNVGIGTSTPESSLYISGNNGNSVGSSTALFKVYDNLKNSIIYMDNASIPSSNNMRIGAYNYTSAGVNGNLEMQAGSNNYQLVLTSALSGYVGLGTNTPVSKLTIVADGGDGITIQSTGVDAGDLIFKEVGGFEKSRIYTNTTPNATGLFISTDLSVTGSITATGAINPSDARYKQNIVTLTNALSNVLQLRGVTYDMKKEFKAKGFGNGQQIGVIAQEVEKIYPQLVNTGADGYKGVDYSKFTPLLIEAIKEQQQQIETLKSKAQYYLILEQKINDLNAKYDLLLKQNTENNK